MSELDKIKKIQNIRELSSYLGYSVSSLSYLLYSPAYGKKYSSLIINKKNGGIRNISVPEKRLLTLQKRLAKKLQKCYEEISYKFTSKTNSILMENIRKSVTHGFRKNLSIQSNAICHINSKIILNIDLKDFFPSINFGRVRGFFIKNSFFQLNEKVATVIAQIVCYKNELPQGAPTSPVISNLITTPMDIRILNLVKNKGVFYTRYADDLTFSTKLNKFPEEFLIISENLSYCLGNKLEKIILDSGFIINNEKIRIQLRKSKQTVTGIVVNKKVNVDRKYYKLLRAQCHSLFTKGYYIDNGIKIFREEYDKLKSLEGKLNFAFYTNSYCKIINELQLEQKNINHKKNKFSSFSQLDNGKNKVNNKEVSSSVAIKNLYLFYLFYLFYKNFVNISKTILLCEGQTDVSYLKLANKKMEFCSDIAISYIKTDGILKKYSDFIGGTSKIIKFIVYYNNNLKKFNISLCYPVIILVDRDNAGEQVVTKYKSQYDKEYKVLTDDITYYNNTNNLYLINLPKILDKEEVQIENYLGDDILKNGINGKKLNLSNKNTENGEVGKERFFKLISKHRDQVDFSYFKLVFDEIQKIERNFFERFGDSKFNQ